MAEASITPRMNRSFWNVAAPCFTPSTNSYTPSTMTSFHGKRSLPHVRFGKSTSGIFENPTFRHAYDSSGNANMATSRRDSPMPSVIQLITDPKKNAPDTYSTIWNGLRQLCSSAHCRMESAAPRPAVTAAVTTSGRANAGSAPAASTSSTDTIMNTGAAITSARRWYSGASFRAATTHTTNTGSMPRFMISCPNKGLSGNNPAKRANETSSHARTNANPKKHSDR